MCHAWPLFSSCQLTVKTIQFNFLLMTGFKPRTSGVRINRASNWAITTEINFLLKMKQNVKHQFVYQTAEG